MDKIKSASPGARALVERMLRVSESSRPSARECLAMPWLVEGGGPHVLRLSGEQVKALGQEREHRLWWSTVTAHAATQLPASRLAKLSDRFEQMSRGHGGTVSRRDLASFLQELGLSREAATRTADAADYDRDEEIEWSEFVAAMLPASQELFSVALLGAFQSLDTNCDGALDREEVMQLLEQGHIDGLHMPAGKTAETMIEELDTDENGNVSYEEFLEYFVRHEATDGPAPVQRGAADGLVGSRRSVGSIMSSPQRSVGGGRASLATGLSQRP